MDIWLNLLHDYEELEKEKKAKTASEKGRKELMVMLCEKMTQTIRERRAAERSPGSDFTTGDGHGLELENSQSPESLQSVPVMTKDRRSTDHSVKGDRAFACQRRTVDRVLDGLSDGDNVMVMQIKEMEQNKMDRLEAIEHNKEAIERDKLDVLRQVLGTQITEGASSSVEMETQRFAVEVKALEAQTEELREAVRDQAVQGKEIQKAIRDQGQRTEEKLDVLMALFKQPH